jgi:dinuclear metal center YbgI/SA1388 family protein
MAGLKEIVAWLDETLDVKKIRDSAHNGLQVEGKDQVANVVTGVSANLALIDAAIDLHADMILVHHGLVWGGIQAIRGPLRQRLARLLTNDISLVAYHLPLDMHKRLGNNALLAQGLGLVDQQPFGDYKGQLIGVRGRLAAVENIEPFLLRVANLTGSVPRVFVGHARPIASVAVCSGGAAELVDEAILAKCDAFVSGEATEYTPAMASEGSIDVVVAGHHATERFGVRALGEALAERFHIHAQFVDVANDL